ncbi:MAG: UTP--glucose-phosphate uridylyltransferase, partial [Thermoleophilaceae bacterium]|nr:UTP--glucose-phosphate uridylyltransferase [Thermoleophilaceae bacterium]
IVRSDAYSLAEDWTVQPAADPIPLVSLDSDYYKLVGDFDARFPFGAPSLRECRRLAVDGDVSFGRDVAVKGEVRLEGPQAIPDGAVLEG